MRVSTVEDGGLLPTCIFVVPSPQSPVRWARIWALFLAAVAIGFTLLSLRIIHRDTGIETCGRPIWWRPMRPIHALLYATSAALAWKGYPLCAAVCLVIDVLVGIVGACRPVGASRVYKGTVRPKYRRLDERASMLQ